MKKLFADGEKIDSALLLMIEYTYIKFQPSAGCGKYTGASAKVQIAIRFA